MSYALTALQEAVQAKLSASPALAALLGSPLQLYDYVPPAAIFPRVVYGDQTALALDTKTSTGLEVTFTLLVYSRARGRRELRAIESALYTALHQQPLTLGAASLVQAQFTRSQQRLEADGLTFRSALTFRITITD